MLHVHQVKFAKILQTDLYVGILRCTSGTHLHT